MTSTVYIAKNVYGGDGLGRLGDGRVIFVPGAWSGEQVKAEIVEEKKHFVKARLVEVVESSPDRVDGSATAVPGMVYANLSYEGELKAKEQQLREFFERARISIGNGTADIGRGTRPACPLNYRSKVVYHFAKYGNAWRIGYRVEPSHEIVDIVDDPLARPEINAMLAEIRRSVTMLLTTGPIQVRKETERKGNVTIRWTKKSGVKWWIGDAPKDMVLKETTCGIDFEVPAGGFYQVNPEVGEELVQAVVEEYKKGADKAPNILDLYCGVGVFGLCCKPPMLVGVESGREAVDFAKRNAAACGMPAARFFAEQVGRSVRRLKTGPAMTAIVDPPRGGMEPNVPKWLANSGVSRILYVSCDPATLMRDLKTLSQAYSVESVKWFNMFPRTARFETLVVLEKINCHG